MLDKTKNRGTPKPYLRNLNVRWFEFDLSDIQNMRFEDSEQERYSARKGDLIVCEGGYPGRGAIWMSDEPIFLQKALHRIRFHEPERARWFLYLLYMSDLNGSLKSSFTGTGIQHLTGETIRKIQVPLPPFDEQQKIIAMLDNTFEKITTLKISAERKILALTELKQAVLDRAFSGELCPNLDTTPLVLTT